MVSSIFFTFGDFRSNFSFLPTLFGPASLHRPYRSELVKWPKVGQNGSKIEKKVATRFLTQFRTFWWWVRFFRFCWFSVKFQIFAKSFWSGSPTQAVPPRTSKMAKSGSKRVQNQKKKLPRDFWRNSAHFDGKFDFFLFLVIFGQISDFCSLFLVRLPYICCTAQN